MVSRPQQATDFWLTSCLTGWLADWTDWLAGWWGLLKSEPRTVVNIFQDVCCCCYLKEFSEILLVLVLLLWRTFSLSKSFAVLYTSNGSRTWEDIWNADLLAVAWEFSASDSKWDCAEDFHISKISCEIFSGLFFLSFNDINFKEYLALFIFNSLECSSSWNLSCVFFSSSFLKFSCSVF